MIEDLIRTPQFRRFAPLVGGIFFATLFVSLGMWQLDRAAQKKAMFAMFEGDAPFSRVNDYGNLPEFSRIQLDGEYLPERQILIDNIVREGRNGYYVITPFKPNTNQPVMLVNRGWLPKTGRDAGLPDIGVAAGIRTVRGLAGNLPRVAIRHGEAFVGDPAWPRIAVYPRADEIANVLGQQLLPTVLLLAPQEEDGFVRRWQPNVSGPSTHYGYTVQWFAMAATALALMFWHLRRQKRRD